VKGGKPLALLMLDLNKFKSINDTHGHPAGDAVLRATAQVVRSQARAPALPSRYGGEEMAVVLPGANRAAAATLAEAIRRAIAAKPMVVGSTAIPVTASIGVAVYEPGGPIRTPAMLIKAADLAVYNAKRSGRNCVRVLALQQPAPSTATAGAPKQAAPAA
jgi:diguanylate cyclase (GGDEF)-like protein